MLKLNGSMQLSASDLVAHLNCRHLTNLDIAVANGTLEKPKIWDPLIEVLKERGDRHEHDYIEHLRREGFSVAVVEGVGIRRHGRHPENGRGDGALASTSSCKARSKRMGGADEPIF